MEGWRGPLAVDMVVEVDQSWIEGGEAVYNSPEAGRSRAARHPARDWTGPIEAHVLLGSSSRCTYRVDIDGVRSLDIILVSSCV